MKMNYCLAAMLFFFQRNVQRPLKSCLKLQAGALHKKLISDPAWGVKEYNNVTKQENNQILHLSNADIDTADFI